MSYYGCVVAPSFSIVFHKSYIVNCMYPDYGCQEADPVSQSPSANN